MMEDRVDRALQLLEAKGEEHFGRGWRSETDRRLGHSRGALAKSIYRGTLRLRDFLAVLDVLGLRASAFFHALEELEAEGNHDLEFFDELEAKARTIQEPEILLRLASLDLERALSRPADFSSQTVRKIVQARRSDPVGGAELAEATLCLIAKDLLPADLALPLVLEWSSCQLRSDHLYRALAGFLKVKALAKAHGRPELVAEALLRLPDLIYRFNARPETSLRTADAALLRFLDLGDQPGVARALTIRSWYLSHQGDCRAADQNLRFSLSLLPTDHYYVGYNHQAQAVVKRQLGKLDEALYHLLQAESHSKDDPYLRGMTKWAQADFYRSLEKHPCATKAFSEARAILQDLAPVQAVLVSLDLAHHYLDLDRPNEARATTRQLSTLVGRLAKYPIVESAVLDLLRLPLSGQELTKVAIAAAVRAIHAKRRPSAEKN